jgi:hypothetical protein
MRMSHFKICFALASIFITACGTQYGGLRHFEVMSTPSGADVYLVPRYDAEQNGWTNLSPAALVARANELSAYRQGETPLELSGNEQSYLLVVISGSRAAARLIQPNPGQRIQITLP